MVSNGSAWKAALWRDTAGAMSQANVEIVRRLFEQWATGNLSADCFGPDIEYLGVGAKTPDMEARWLGLDEVSTAMRDYLRAFSDLRIEAERIIDLSGNRVLVLSRHTARGAQSGVPIEHEIGDLATLRDGKIVRFDSFWDRAEALEAAEVAE
jgi:ketosteroid isomerase-like protein